jgi:hypothetical protein
MGCLHTSPNYDKLQGMCSRCKVMEDLRVWGYASTFDDLCMLMQRSLLGNFNSFTSSLYRETSCILEKDSVKYRDDFIRLNELGFLTIDSQPSISEFITTDEWITLHEQREYIKGFIKKDRLSKLLSKLSDYIVRICTISQKRLDW